MLALKYYQPTLTQLWSRAFFLMLPKNEVWTGVSKDIFDVKSIFCINVGITLFSWKRHCFANFKLVFCVFVGQKLAKLCHFEISSFSKLWSKYGCSKNVDCPLYPKKQSAYKNLRIMGWSKLKIKDLLCNFIVRKSGLSCLPAILRSIIVPYRLPLK